MTVTDNNDYVSYSSIDFTVTLDAIRDKLIKTHGGFLRVRYAGGAKYLDYIADFDSLSPQTVEYGKNLLDVKISRDHTDRVSVLLPLGAKIKDIDAEGQEYETGERVQITSVNGGKNYIVDEEAAAEIGMIPSWMSQIPAQILEISMRVCMWSANLRPTALTADTAALAAPEITSIRQAIRSPSAHPVLH